MSLSPGPFICDPNSGVVRLEEIGLIWRGDGTIQSGYSSLWPEHSTPTKTFLESPFTFKGAALAIWGLLFSTLIWALLLNWMSLSLKCEEGKKFAWVLPLQIVVTVAQILCIFEHGYRRGKIEQRLVPWGIWWSEDHYIPRWDICIRIMKREWERDRTSNIIYTSLKTRCSSRSRLISVLGLEVWGEDDGHGFSAWP